jgi:hypothetical protein
MLRDRYVQGDNKNEDLTLAGRELERRERLLPYKMLRVRDKLARKGRKTLHFVQGDNKNEGMTPAGRELERRERLLRH